MRQVKNMAQSNQGKVTKNIKTFYPVQACMVFIIVLSVLYKVECDDSTKSPAVRSSVTEVCKTGCPCSVVDRTLECIHRNTLEKIPRLSSKAIMANITQM